MFAAISGITVQLCEYLFIYGFVTVHYLIKPVVRWCR